MTDWLSEIEEEFTDNSMRFKVDVDKKRMTRVLRELAEVAKCAVVEDKYFNPTGLFEAREALSDDAKELLK